VHPDARGANGDRILAAAPVLTRVRAVQRVKLVDGALVRRGTLGMPRTLNSQSVLGSALAPLAAASTLRLPDTGFLRQSQVLAFVPISKSTLWRRVQLKEFPAPVKLSAHVTAWRVEDVRQWILAQG